MKFEGRDIFKIRVPRNPLDFSEEFEWAMAAKWAGYRVKDFEELEGAEQSRIVALYRTNTQLEAVIAHDSQKKAERKAGRRAKK